MATYEQTVARLYEAVSAVCPLNGLRVGTVGLAASVTFTASATATAAQKAAAQNAVNGFDWSQAAHDSWQNLADRTAAVNALADTAAPTKLVRGAVAVLVDEVNLLREWITAFNAVVAAATTLADLKSRVATLAAAQPMPDRTLTQARTNVVAKINAGLVDT